MRRRHLLPALGLVAIALVTAFAVVLVSSLGGGDDAKSPVLSEDIDPGASAPPGVGLPRKGIEASGSLTPRTTLFGDTIVAQVDVVLDRRRVDPGSVRVGTEFLPWEVVGQPVRVRRDSGANTYLRTSFLLRCTGSPCAPANDSSALDFSAARVSYAAPGVAPGARTAISAGWPTLLVYSRFAAANLDRTTGLAAQNPWHADLASFPAATYRIAPGLLLATLAALALLFATAGVALAFIAIPRRRHEPEPVPEPEPELVIVLTPLEQALELLEDAGRADGTEDRRRALELVAEVLDLEHPELARAARTLAWSEEDPVIEQTSGLATRVRASIDLDVSGNGSGNGRAH